MVEELQPSSYPQQGRVYHSERRVRLGDVTPKGRLRLDAVARYLQDIATDDALDGNYDDPHGWVVRRTEMWIFRFPKYLDELQLHTWCGGVGSHWAERRTRLSLGPRSSPEPVIEAAALWVRVDLSTLKPRALSESFRSLIGATAAGRRVSARLHVARDLDDTMSPNQVTQMALRFSDFDAVGHLNNAVYWEPVEEYLGQRRDMRAPLHVTVEHHHSVESPHAMRLEVFERDERVVLRMIQGTTVAALGRIRRG